MNRSWNTTSDSTSALVSLATDLENWNKDVFGNIFARKRKLERRIEGTRRQLALAISDHYIELEHKLCTELEEVLQQEQVLWFQKSRTDFLLNGDRNTRFYHLSTIIRRRHNRILRLQSDSGESIEDPDVIKEIITNFFKGLYTTDEAPEPQDWYNLNHTFPELSPLQMEEIEAPFVATEVLTALK